MVGLLDLLLVEINLLLMLGSQLSQGLGQLALKLLLSPAVDLHYTRLVPTPGLTQLLKTPTEQTHEIAKTHSNTEICLCLMTNLSIEYMADLTFITLLQV